MVLQTSPEHVIHCHATTTNGLATAESSVRKRRSELAQENVLLDTGRVRKNRHGNEEKVWMHREFHHNPPPLVDRVQPISKDQQLQTAQARILTLEAAIRSVLNRPDLDAASMAQILSKALPPQSRKDDTR